MTSITAHIQSVLKSTHPRDTEFHQAVNEILQDVAELYEETPDYGCWNVMERLIEPDRILRFRVCWEDDDGKIQVNRGWRVQRERGDAFLPGLHAGTLPSHWPRHGRASRGYQCGAA